MKILVIGSGFLGSPIIQFLSSQGNEVTSFSRSIKANLNIRQIEGDIFSKNQIDLALQWRPQAVINTAWITEFQNYTQHPANIDYANFAVDLAKMCVDYGIEHLVTLGSCAEYGVSTDPILAGVSRLKPTNLYSQQKILAFQQIRNILKETRVRMTWARIFQPYGPNQDRNRLIPYLMNSMKFKREIKLKDTISKLDWISTRDVASAIYWTLITKLPQEIDIGTSIGHTNLEVIEALSKLLHLPNSTPQLLANSNSLNQNCIVSKDSPLFLSKWSPSDSLLSGLEWTLSHEKT